MRMRRRSQRESGQVAVETAIVMPLFVFLILGLLQLGLLHQARVLAKYAAYKAVRVGSIHNAKKSAMKRAALAVMLPMTGMRRNFGGGQGMFYNASAGKFAMSWGQAKGGVEKTNDTDTPLKITVCDPVTNPSGDFDDPDGDMGPGDWQKSNAGRLAIQVTQFQEMVVPFANGVIFYILVQQERAELYHVLRMRPEGDQRHKDWLSTRVTANGESRSIDKFVNLAQQGTYVIPIRASWSMRMQSNYLTTNDDFKLPNKNMCRIPWKVMGSHKGKD
jgi:hypothetical protein